MVRRRVVLMAGKAKRLDARKRRQAKKRGRKAAEKAKYEAWKLAGQNTKSRRAKKQAKRKTVRNARHLQGPCGNIGCKRCNPIPENLLTPIQRHAGLH